MAGFGLPALGSARSGTRGGSGIRGGSSAQVDEFDDGFDLSSWRLEVEQELQCARNIAQEAWRAEQRKLQPSASTSSFASKGKLQASASASSFASKATVKTNKSSASRQSPRHKLPPLELEELHGGLQAEERLTISQAIFSPYDPIQYRIQRGNTDAVLALRDVCTLHTARERLRHIEEVSAEQRRQASRWREKAVKNNLIASARTSYTKPTRSHQLMHSFLKIWQKTPQLEPETISERPIVRYTEASSDSSDDEDQSDDDKGKKKRVAYFSSIIRKTLNARLLAREKADKEKHRSKGKHASRIKDPPFVHKEQEAEQAAFAQFADETLGAMCFQNLLRCLAALGLAGANSLERQAVEVMLMKVYLPLFRDRVSTGLPAELGNTNPTKMKLIKQKLAQMTNELQLGPALLLPATENLDMVAHEEEADTQSKLPAYTTRTEPFLSMGVAVQHFVEAVLRQERVLSLPQGRDQRASRTLQSENRNRQELQDVIRCIPIVFDEFSLDIVRNARQQLSEMREKHDSEVVRTESKISSEEFKSLAVRLHLNLEQASQAVQQATALARREQCQDVDERWLNRDAIHDLLQYTRELCERHQYRLQQEVQRSAGLTDADFWKFRDELTKLSDQLKSMSLPIDAKLPKLVVCQLVKQLGFQPYHVRMQTVLSSCFKRAGGNQGADLNFSQILHLTRHLRNSQKVARKEKLWRIFRLQLKSGRVTSTIPTHRLEEVVFDPVLGLNLHVDTIMEKEALANLLEQASGSNDISFQEVEDVCQNACELLHGMRAKANFAKAMWEGLSMQTYSEYQQLYDRFDVDCSGGLQVDEVKEAMHSQLGRAISSQELEQCYRSKQLNPAKQLQLWDFLRVMDASVTKEQFFTLKDVKPDSLRECIALLPVDHDAISHFSDTEQRAVVASYLSITSDTNMKQLSPPISNDEELLHRVFKETHDYWERLEKKKPAYAAVDDDD
eukprot:TRINITY_DN20890_c0_g1_i1.p1 TRINITY_DN20890_c0_g1~~TRINITY_DN20890_c0_g1_i1.p1  ORF type:complete len:962 (-),score=201.19 TRINITY_DN20890_c0_g1_i1:273-3158(-)